MAITKTAAERLTTALDSTKDQGVQVTVNVMTCCRSCATNEDLGIASYDEPYIWNFAGQGSEFTLRDGDILKVVRDERTEDDCQCYTDEDEYGWDDETDEEVLIREGEGEVECDLCRYGPDEVRYVPFSGVYFYHGGKDGDLTAAETLAAALREQGFKVKWDGTEHDAVFLDLS